MSEEEKVITLARNWAIDYTDRWGIKGGGSVNTIAYDSFHAGYEQGSADALKGGINAWALLGPTSKDINAVALSKKSLEETMTGVRYDRFNKFEEFIVHHEAVRNEMFEQGWQIVPVKLLKMELDKGAESED